MLASLICPGPSLATRKPAGDVFVAVNRAALVAERIHGIASDWMVFGDGGPFLNILPDLKCRPRIFASEKAMIDIANAGQSDRLREFPPYTQWDAAYADWPPMFGWTEFSACAGLVACVRAGATEVNVYGADWTCDQADPDGVALHTNTRTPGRWHDEAIHWAAVVQELGTHGIPVRRILI